MSRGRRSSPEVRHGSHRGANRPAIGAIGRATIAMKEPPSRGGDMRFAFLVLALGASASARHHRPLGPLAGGASCNTISYHGGPLIHSVKIVLLMWSGAATHKDELARYYSAIVDSPYLDWLDEYDQGSYSIGRGSFVAAVVDPSPPPATQLNDTNDI